MSKRFLILLGLTLSLAGSLQAREPFQLGGRVWSRWPEARAQALEQHKPILLVQMLGDLDEEFC